MCRWCYLLSRWHSCKYINWPLHSHWANGRHILFVLHSSICQHTCCWSPCERASKMKCCLPLEIWIHPRPCVQQVRAGPAVPLSSARSFLAWCAGQLPPCAVHFVPLLASSSVAVETKLHRNWSDVTEESSGRLNEKLSRNRGQLV